MAHGREKARRIRRKSDTDIPSILPDGDFLNSVTSAFEHGGPVKKSSLSVSISKELSFLLPYALSAKLRLRSVRGLSKEKTRRGLGGSKWRSQTKA